jgi:hypothetical protein
MPSALAYAAEKPSMLPGLALFGEASDEEVSSLFLWLRDQMPMIGFRWYDDDDVDGFACVSTGATFAPIWRR